ncbi:MAG: hypothetical protein R6U98_06860 [Pirellulaceae bacterium]
MELKKLDKAVSDQLEILGQLTLQHRPDGLDTSEEIAQLGQVREDLGEKQATRDALKQSSSTGAAVKELNAEMARFKEREKSLMIAIGEKAMAVRPAMPGGAAHYSAVDQLRSSRASKSQQLEEIQGQIGQLRSPQLSNWKKPIALSVGGIALVVMLYFAWGHLIRPFLFSVPGWAEHYVPNSAIAISYTNTDKLRDTVGYEDSMVRDADTFFGDKLDFAENITLDDTLAILRVFLDDRAEVTVLRAEKDIQLDDLLPTEGLRRKRPSMSRPEVKKEHFRNIDYYSVAGRSGSSHGFLANPESQVFCFSSNENALRRVLRQWDLRKELELDEELDRALRTALGLDHFFAASSDFFPAFFAEERRLMKTGLLPVPPMLDDSKVSTVAFGFSVTDSTLDIRGAVVFERERYADRDRKEYELDLEALEKAVEDVPDEDRADAELILEIFRGLKVSQRGVMIRVKGSWDIDVLEDIQKIDWEDIEEIKEEIRDFMD